MRERGKDIIKTYNDEYLLSNERINADDNECMLQILQQNPIPSINLENLPRRLNTTFQTIKEILSAMSTIKYEVNDINLYVTISNLESMAYDALCSLSQLGLQTGVINTRQISFNRITPRCYTEVTHYRRFLIEREAFANIVSISDSEFHNYNTLRHQIR